MAAGFGSPRSIRIGYGMSVCLGRGLIGVGPRRKDEALEEKSFLPYPKKTSSPLPIYRANLYHFLQTSAEIIQSLSATTTASRTGTGGGRPSGSAASIGRIFGKTLRGVYGSVG